MNVPTLLAGYLQEQPPKTTIPAETSTKADVIARMQIQRQGNDRQVPLIHNFGSPMQIHHGPRPTGKQIRKARAAERLVKKAAEQAKKLAEEKELAAKLRQPFDLSLPEYNP